MINKDTRQAWRKNCESQVLYLDRVSWKEEELSTSRRIHQRDYRRHGHLDPSVHTWALWHHHRHHRPSTFTSIASRWLLHKKVTPAHQAHANLPFPVLDSCPSHYLNSAPFNATHTSCSRNRQRKRSMEKSSISHVPLTACVSNTEKVKFTVLRVGRLS